MREAMLEARGGSKVCSILDIGPGPTPISRWEVRVSERPGRHRGRRERPQPRPKSRPGPLCHLTR